MLPEAFVVSEEESLVRSQGSAQRAAEITSPERRDAAAVEKIPRVEGAVAQEFVRAAVKLIGAGGRNNSHLCARPLPVFGAVGVAEHVKLPDSINPEQLAACSARGEVDFRGARVFDSVQQKNAFLGTPAGDCKHVPHRRVGCAYPARPLRRVIDNSGVECEELVVASAI